MKEASYTAPRIAVLALTILTVSSASGAERMQFPNFEKAVRENGGRLPGNKENREAAEREMQRLAPELRRQYEAQYGPLIEQYQPARPEPEAPAASVEPASPTPAKSTQALTLFDVFWWLVAAGFGVLLLGAGSIVLTRKVRQSRPTPNATLIPVLSLAQIFSKMACPCCQNRIEFPSAYQGNRIPCPHCERGIVLQADVVSEPPCRRLNYG